MKQVPRLPKYKQLANDNAKYSWLVLALIIIACSVATGLIVNFFNHLHYNNLLLQANNQAGAAQSQLEKEQYDVKFLIDNGPQLNCYFLRSSYARDICFKHENIPNNTQL